MLETINNFVLLAADPLLGWLLALPVDLALFIVAAGTGAILTFFRLFTTNQELLKRVDADKIRLKQLIREAKSRGDKDALQRHRATVGELGIKSMKAEGGPLLASLLPIVLLAVWAFARLGFVPPKEGEPIKIKVYFNQLSIDGTAHIVPTGGLEATEGWVRRIGEDPEPLEGASPDGYAEWVVAAKERPEPYTLEIRHGGRTYTKELLVDGKRFSPTLEFYEGGEISAVQLDLPQYRPFGVVPGIPWIMFEPWIVGYLLIAIPFVLLLKKICGIH